VHPVWPRRGVAASRRCGGGTHDAATEGGEQGGAGPFVSGVQSPLHRGKAGWWRGEAAPFGRSRIRHDAARFRGVATTTSAKRARRARRVFPATTRACLGRPMIERQKPAA